MSRTKGQAKSITNVSCQDKLKISDDYKQYLVKLNIMISDFHTMWRDTWDGLRQASTESKYHCRQMTIPSVLYQAGSKVPDLENNESAEMLELGTMDLG